MLTTFPESTEVAFDPKNEGKAAIYIFQRVDSDTPKSQLLELLSHKNEGEVVPCIVFGRFTFILTG